MGSKIRSLDQTGVWIVIGLGSVLWWIVAGQYSFRRTILVVSPSLAAFMVGCLGGFLPSSYGEESSIGKIRDWLVGVVTALTVTGASSAVRVLKLFNIAYALAHKSCRAVAHDEAPGIREQALSTLREALRNQPDMAEQIRTEWIEPGQGSECLRHDQEFRSLVGLSEERPA